MTKKKSIWHIVLPVKNKIARAIICSVFSSVLSVMVLIFLVYLILALNNSDQIDVFYYFSAMLLCTVFSYIFRLRAYDLSHYAAYDLEAVLRKKIAVHLSALPIGFLAQTGSGAISKIINDDVRSLHGFVADSTPLFARAYAAPIFTFMALCWFDYRMALISLVILLVGLILMFWSIRNKKELSAAYNKAKEEINVAVIEYIQAMPVVRIFDGGEKSFRRYDEALIHYRKTLKDWYKQNGLGARISMLVLNPLPTFIILLIIGTYWYQEGTLPLSGFIASLLFGTGMIESIMPYRSLSHVIDRSNISAKRIEELLNEKGLADNNTSNEQPSDSSIKFENVSFTYPNRNEAALKDINFEVEQGSFVALVGASGAGKTTVAKLIPRFWDVSSGKIKIGGVNIQNMSGETLMNQIAFVFQDNFLFSDTIINNIRMGNPEATENEVIDAAIAAQADDFIRQLPEGYQTNAGERGDMLSGGQKQRIAIARAILQNRPILVLDEATSFSDTENEALLMRALKNLMKGKTVIMIAHRLPTIKTADLILVFDKGKLSESGNHEQLMSSSVTYSRLWDAYLQARNWHI
ncbi:ABC transporter ATP-binding protein [Dysgonomonas sp. BGC7]|uniref:ABC transporter ATP-binding protein n=1 Tax=Dysgonomonas sp. BGC7 TaxID=1658008 RepID=UPI000680715D|nr:ABC transporter ATP-binding protein [Dysgonomonas sp. BGC7]MBD8390465.1 ABC transporter ATP-binding protein [Dysgonomonas sp. BGC7]